MTPQFKFSRAGLAVCLISAMFSFSVNAAEPVKKEQKVQVKKFDFDSCDTDKNGSLSKAEFDACAGDNPMLKGRFDEMDANKDGAITKEELNQYAAKKKQGKAKDKKFDFDTCDTNKDGNLSKAEFEACAGDDPMTQGRFEAMDANKDGSLSKDEMKQYTGKKQKKDAKPKKAKPQKVEKAAQ